MSVIATAHVLRDKATITQQLTISICIPLLTAPVSQWLMPNASGSRGVPKYVKQLEGSSDGRNGTYFNREWTDSDVGFGEVEGTEKDASTSTSTPDENQRSESNRISSDTGSLSASAVEFKPKVTVAATPVGSGKVSYAAAAAKISNSA